MRTRIKICGLKSRSAIVACKDAGADAVGFVFYPPSPRSVTVDQAAELAQHLGPWQTPVALFVNPTAAEVIEVIGQVPTILLQFHGDETSKFCESFARPYIKAIRMKAGVDLLAESKKFGSAQALLLDSWSSGFGGSGHTFDWSLLSEFDQSPQTWILSGGLDCTNVAQAIQQHKVYGVDVSSGVEVSPGLKSETRIAAFCRAVQQADFDQSLKTSVKEQQT